MPSNGNRGASNRKLSGFRCPKCLGNFMFWEWKTMSWKGYSCQNCGYNFAIDEIDFLTAGKDLGVIVEYKAKQTLARKGF